MPSPEEEMFLHAVEVPGTQAKVVRMPAAVPPGPATEGLAAKPFVWRDPATIPPREWLYGRLYIRGNVSVTVAPGGIGKTSLAIVEALAMTTGKPLLGDKVFGGKPLRVWLYNGEDPQEELDRRIGAAMLHYGITPHDIGGRLFVNSGRDMPLKLAVETPNGGRRLNQPALASLETTLTENRIDVASFDPWVGIHGVHENDNVEIDMVAKALGGVAERARCALGFNHHARKSLAAGETRMEDSRGASALIDAARVGRVLNVMTDQEAAELGIEIGRRFRYFRADDGKANLAPKAEKASWFYMESVDLGNATPERPSDFVGVATTWDKPGQFDGVTTSHLLEVQRRLHAESDWRDNIQSDMWGGKVVAEVIGLDAEDEADKSKIKKLLRQWKKSGALKVENRPGPDRKPRPCLAVGEWATEGG